MALSTTGRRGNDGLNSTVAVRGWLSHGHDWGIRDLARSTFRPSSQSRQNEPQYRLFFDSVSSFLAQKSSFAYVIQQVVLVYSLIATLQLSSQ